MNEMIKDYSSATDHEKELDFLLGKIEKLEKEYAELLVKYCVLKADKGTSV